MSLLTLAPVTLTPGGGNPQDITDGFTSLGSNTGVLFQNTGREVLLVMTNSTGPSAVTSEIGTTVQGQAVPGVAPGSPQPASKLFAYGPYPSQYDKQDGTSDVEIDLGTVANITGVLLLRIPGVF